MLLLWRYFLVSEVVDVCVEDYLFFFGVLCRINFSSSFFCLQRVFILVDIVIEMYFNCVVFFGNLIEFIWKYIEVFRSCYLLNFLFYFLRLVRYLLSYFGRNVSLVFF